MEHYTRLFNSLVAKTVQRAVNRAPAFAARLKAAGMTADDLQSVADLTHLAVLHKDDAIELQRQ